MSGAVEERPTRVDVSSIVDAIVDGEVDLDIDVIDIEESAEPDAPVDDGPQAGAASDEDAAPDAVPADDDEASEKAYDIVNHLLWHKALIDETDGGERLDEYISLVRSSEKGEHLTIRNPFDKSIAIAFELVLQEHLNPWKIDLGEFSRMYLKRAQEEELDLGTAGRIILMAWTVLRLQSTAMLELAEALAAPPPEPEPEFLDWGDIGDWDYDSDEFEYTQRVKHASEAPIDEKIRRKGASRKVTLMELVEAFEEVRREAEERAKWLDERERTRALLKQQHNDSVNEMMHEEDPETEQRHIWDRILSMNGHDIPLKALYEPNIDSFVTAFNGVLFLAADRKVDVWQEDFPYGPILIKNLQRAAEAERASESASPEA